MDKVFALKNVKFHYKKSNKSISNIFENISLDIFSDEITALIGENGSGKTTITKLMMGILKPLQGDIYVFETNIKEMSLGQIGKKVGYLFQNPERQLFATSVYEELAFVMDIKGYDKKYIDKEVNETLELLNLLPLKNEVPFFLSGGEKQRLALASILVNKPKYLVLDEPTTSLDIKRKEILSNIIDKLKEEKIGTLIVSHDKQFVEKHANRIIQLTKGEIVNDTRT